MVGECPAGAKPLAAGKALLGELDVTLLFDLSATTLEREQLIET